MEPWYKVTTPRKEVREGRSFNPDEFAIHLEQVIARTAPQDYRDPKQFFSRTCFTRALREHAGMVLRRLSGETSNTAPVMTLITQFGGGKTHTLTALYHLGSNGEKAIEYPGISELIKNADVNTVPKAKVAAFVGNAWDPQEGRETPWIDIAWQLAGEKGVKELGSAAKTTPPGTESISRVFKLAGNPVLILLDEVLNFLNRHRGMAEQFFAYIQNLTVATTGVTNGVAVFLLLKSKAKALKSLPEISPEPHPEPKPGLAPTPVPQPEPVAGAAKRSFRISGNIPPEIWNRLGTKILPKLRSGSDLKVGIEFTVTVDINVARSFEADLQQILEDLGIANQVRVEWS